MTDTLAVVLDDVVAGTLTRLPGGRLRFDYRDEYRDRPNATPLSVVMPTQVRSHSDRNPRRPQRPSAGSTHSARSATPRPTGGRTTASIGSGQSPPTT